MSNQIEEYNKIASSLLNNYCIYNLDKNCYIESDKILQYQNDRILYIKKEEKKLYEGTKTMCYDIEYSDNTTRKNEFIGRFVTKNVKGNISFKLVGDNLIIFEVIGNDVITACAVYNTIDHVSLAYSMIDTLRLLSEHYKIPIVKEPNKLLIRSDSEKRRRMR